jgi:hypothetical protein
LQDKAGLQDFRPHFRAVLENLSLLQQVLQLQPEPQLTQSSSKTPQPAVGSHRVWACAILHMLLLHNNLVIDRAVSDAQLLPAAVALSLAHERCSAVQCRAAEMLCSSLSSSVPELWQGLFTAGLGCGLKQAGSEQLLRPLHEALVQIGKWRAAVAVETHAWLLGTCVFALGMQYGAEQVASSATVSCCVQRPV